MPRERISLDRIDEWVQGIDSVSTHRERMARLQEVEFDLDFESFSNIDPFSSDYSERIRALYLTLSGVQYDVNFEKEDFNKNWINHPFPYHTKSKKSVADNLIGIGTILRHLPEDPPARIIEMGAGWANVSLILARTGYNVFALDIDEKCGLLIKHWSSLYGVSNNISHLQMEFDGIGQITDKYDAAIFFKSFHHSLGHFELLVNTHKILSDGGHLILCAEPIFGSYPVHWGLRNDGMSIYMIRKKGWLELGFRRSYIHECLSAAGFDIVEEKHGQELSTQNILVARKR